MTAPLPPLPVENFVDKDGLWDEKYGPYSADEMQSYAKLAVRQALERAAFVCESKQPEELMTGKVDHNEVPWTWVCCNAIRAMIEEEK